MGGGSMRCGHLTEARRHSVSARSPRPSSPDHSSKRINLGHAETRLLTAILAAVTSVILLLNSPVTAAQPFPFIDVNNDGVYEADIDTPIGSLTGEAAVISTDQSIVVPAGAVIHFKGSYLEFDAGNSITVSGPLTTQGFIYLSANHVSVNARVAANPDGVGIDAQTIDVAAPVVSRTLVSLSATDVHLWNTARVIGGALGEIKATSATMDPGSVVRGNHINIALSGGQDCRAEGSSIGGLEVSVTSDTGSLYFNSAKLSGLGNSPKAMFAFVTGGPEIDLVGVKKTPKMLNVDPSAPNGVVLE
jgi:hypothetical protein